MSKRQKNAGQWVAAYLRVSTAGQSHASQEHEVSQYVKAHGLRAIVYRDKATGANLDRPAFERLQRDIFAGRVSTVIVWRLDRLARNLRDGVNVLADWCERGVRLVSVTQQLDLSGAVGRMVTAVLLGVAEMERENINERIRAGIAARKAKGLPMGRVKGDIGHGWNPALRKVDPAIVRPLRAQGIPVAKIAERFNVTRQGVYAALRA
jgi:DNA invertase Pin-like site-specific DNA recombinase